MFSKLRKRLTYANVAMTLALLFAMTGGAYAASKFVITSTKQIKPSVLKQLQGKAGKAGAAGANGANGANGAQGPAGATGPGGPQGPAGINGTPGTSGAPGAKGAAGSPWTAGGTLPSERTETGVWGLSELAKASGLYAIHIPISFNIPLAAPIVEAEKCGEAGEPACVIHIFEGESIPAGCTGTVVAERVTGLGADPGNLCIHITYAESLTAAQLIPVDSETAQAHSAGKSGTTLTAVSLGEGAHGSGTWAVTAP
jgi:hypothetical protein